MDLPPPAGASTRRSVAALAVLALMACGGGPPTAQEYVASAEEVCARADAALAEGAGTVTDAASLLAEVQRAVGVVRGAVAELDALELPEADPDLYEQVLLAPLRGQLAASEATATQLETAPDTQGLPQAEPVDVAALRDLGFVDCVEFAQS